MLKAELKRRISEKINGEIVSAVSVGGGCISEAYRIETNSGDSYFIKANPFSPPGMFPKEANGLIELKKTGALRVPSVISAEKDFIITEFIGDGPKEKNFFENFGRNFAGMHRYRSDKYGFYEDNYIGSNVQSNLTSGTEAENWTEFYFNKRILFQFKLTEKIGNSTEELSKGIKELEKKIDKILSGSREAPSLLHGDLWSGNFIIDEKGSACLIDPAVYYGHREADLAMTKLFGGFSPEFYEAYNEAFPLPDGFGYRENIYKLYQVLNHLNLFGGSYYQQTVSLIRFYL